MDALDQQKRLTQRTDVPTGQGVAQCAERTTALEREAGDDRGLLGQFNKRRFFRRVEEDFGYATVREAANRRCPLATVMLECVQFSGAPVRKFSRSDIATLAQETRNGDQRSLGATVVLDPCEQRSFRWPPADGRRPGCIFCPVPAYRKPHSPLP